MQLDFSTFFDFIFPPSDDERLVRQISSDDFLNKYRSRMVNEIICLSSFSDPTVRASIHLTKFHAHQKAIALLSSLLTAWTSSLPAERAYILMPIPLSGARQQQRGYNQVALVAETLHQQNVRVQTSFLVKTKNTKPQTALNRQQRLLNLKGAFTASGNAAELAGKHIIILDDVATTGATLRAAKAALLPHSPASITCVALAH